MANSEIGLDEQTINSNQYVEKGKNTVVSDIASQLALAMMLEELRNGNDITIMTDPPIVIKGDVVSHE